MAVIRLRYKTKDVLAVKECKLYFLKSTRLQAFPVAGNGKELYIPKGCQGATILLI
jgi:hypothetical protein